MLQYFKIKRKSYNYHSKEVFWNYFINVDHHTWIKNDKYISANFEEFFAMLTLDDINHIYKQKEVLFIPATGKYSCAIDSSQSAVILIFPELMQLLRSFHAGGALAVLAHEFGHFYHDHAHKNIDPIEAQVEADDYALKFGLFHDLESFLHSQPESIEKRVRLSYLTSKYFGEVKKSSE